MTQEIKKIWDYNISIGTLIPENPEQPKVWAMDVEGRRVLYQHYGQPNCSGYWDVHHIDQNRNNNDINNLLVLHRDSHNAIHNF